MVISFEVNKCFFNMYLFILIWEDVWIGQVLYQKKEKELDKLEIWSGGSRGLGRELKNGSC